MNKISVKLSALFLLLCQLSNAQQYVENTTSSDYVGKWGGKTPSVGMYYHGSGLIDHNTMGKYGIYRSHGGANAPFAGHTTVLNIGTSGNGNGYGFQLASGSSMLSFRTFGSAGNYNSWYELLHKGNFTNFLSSLSFAIDGGGKVGIGVANPETKLHVRNKNVGKKTQHGTMIFQDEDALVDIISGPSYTWGSGFNLAEGNEGAATNTDVWSIVRKTNAMGSSLNFNYGTNNNHLNPTLITFNTNGSINTGGNITVNTSISKTN